uniref:hypothetical protein n=1 Tax=uncultured Bacteroides sp. TaxID=162156 RepID=UPI0025E377A6
KLRHFRLLKPKNGWKIFIFGVKTDVGHLKLEKTGARANFICLVISELPAYFSQMFFCSEKKFS